MPFWERIEQRYCQPRGAVLLDDPSITSKMPVFNGVFSSLNAAIVTMLLLEYNEPGAALVPPCKRR